MGPTKECLQVFMAGTLLSEAKRFSFSTSLIIAKVLFKAKIYVTQLV